MNNKIPRLRLRISALLYKAEQNNDLITYESSIPSLAYITDGQEILIVTNRRGYLRIQGDRIKQLTEELKAIREDNERFRRTR